MDSRHATVWRGVQVGDIWNASSFRFRSSSLSCFYFFCLCLRSIGRPESLSDESRKWRRWGGNVVLDKRIIMAKSNDIIREKKHFIRDKLSCPSKRIYAHTHTRTLHAHIIDTGNLLGCWRLILACVHNSRLHFLREEEVGPTFGLSSYWTMSNN